MDTFTKKQIPTIQMTSISIDYKRIEKNRLRSTSSSIVMNSKCFTKNKLQNWTTHKKT